MKKASAGVISQSIGWSHDTFPLIPVCPKWESGTMKAAARAVWLAPAWWEVLTPPTPVGCSRAKKPLSKYSLVFHCSCSDLWGFFFSAFLNKTDFPVGFWRRCKNALKLLISFLPCLSAACRLRGPFFAWTTICTLKHAAQLRSASRHCARRRATAHSENWKMPGVVLVLVGSTQRLASLPGTRCSGLHRVECLFPACLLRWIMSTLQGLTTSFGNCGGKITNYGAGETTDWD